MPAIHQNYELVGIGKIKPHPKNPRRGNVGAISESIEKNGFFGACVVQKSTGHILAGNHRYLAAKEQGLTELPVIFIDCDDDQALRILLVDNKTNDDASYDNSALAEILSQLANETGLAGTGYDGDELDLLIRSLTGSAPDPNKEWTGMPEFNQEDKSAWRSIIVHFRDPEALDKFIEATEMRISPTARYAWYPEMEIETALDKRYARSGNDQS